MFRIYVERKDGFQSEDVSKGAATRIFSEPQSDSVVYTELETDPADIPTVTGFIGFNKKELDSYREKMGLAMDLADIQFLQDYFK